MQYFRGHSSKHPELAKQAILLRKFGQEVIEATSVRKYMARPLFRWDQQKT